MPCSVRRQCSSGVAAAARRGAHGIGVHRWKCGMWWIAPRSPSLPLRRTSLMTTPPQVGKAAPRPRRVCVRANRHCWQGLPAPRPLRQVLWLALRLTLPPRRLPLCWTPPPWTCTPTRTASFSCATSARLVVMDWDALAVCGLLCHDPLVAPQRDTVKYIERMIPDVPPGVSILILGNFRCGRFWCCVVSEVFFCLSLFVMLQRHGLPRMRHPCRTGRYCASCVQVRALVYMGFANRAVCLSTAHQ